jgi:hypothetical protein
MLFCVLAAVVVGADVDPEPRAANKVIASVNWYEVRYAGLLQRTHVLARSPAELLAAMPLLGDRSTSQKDQQAIASAAAVKALGVKSSDWSKQMLLVEVVGLKAKDGTLTVSWKLHEPENKEDCVKSFPAALALVPAYKGKVVFEQTK